MYHAFRNSTGDLVRSGLMLFVAISLAACGANISSDATPVNQAPVITSQPADQSVTVGQTASFSVTATGTAPLTYQWQRGGSPIMGATSATFVTPAAVAGDDGAQFSVVVANAVQSVTSTTAQLTVSTPAGVAPGITGQPA